MDCGSLIDDAKRARWSHRRKPGQQPIKRPRSQIAKTPGFDAAKIALFLLDPHPKMPDMGRCLGQNAVDLAAYIATLK
jgi:hypothetical protein